MPLVRIARHVRRPKKEPRPGDSKAHLRFIASLPCCVCGAAPLSDPHHLMGDLKPGMGMKAEDRWSLPLCPRFHHIPGVHAHGNDLEYLAARGLDGKEIAKALWRVSQKHGPESAEAYDAGLRVIDRFRQEAALKMKERAA